MKTNLLMRMEKKKRMYLMCILLCMCTLSLYARQYQYLNSAWKYRQGDFPEAKGIAYDDGRWENIGIPHSFSIPYFMSKDFYVGYGWYRKEINLSKEDLRNSLYLDFDGVFQQTEIFLNGHKAGEHTGGYTGFRVPISSFVHEGNNILAVRVNNIWRPDVAPRAGEHTFSGGIYRNVKLVKVNPLHVDWYGTFVTTPGLETSNGKASHVLINTEIRNNGEESAKFMLVSYVIDANGKRISSSTTTNGVAVAGSTVRMAQELKLSQKPFLWSPEHPVLYKVINRIYKGKKLVDQYETPFGFRWIKWTADKGFFLNGKHRYIRGTNVHQDQAGWGDAVTDSAAARDVQMMKDAGFDFIRGSHYPHSPAFVDACDWKGMMFWSEAVFWGIGGFRPDGYWNSSAYPVNEKDKAAFEQSALQQLREMIRIHRNHPSIVAWSMSNEAFFSSPKVMDGVRGLLGKMVAESHKLDPSRPAAVGGAQRPLGDARIDRIGDLAGYNGDGATQTDFQQPGVASLVSEYGSVTADRPGSYSPGWGDLQKNDIWKGFPWRSGQAIWCGFDHGSIAGSALGKMGIVDYFRIPKRSWYWYRNEYKGIAPPEWPVNGTPARLKLTATKLTGIRTDGTDDVLLNVSVCDVTGKELSNSPSVSLKIISGPGIFPTGKSITFSRDSDIRILDGKAAISLRSYYAGSTVVEASSANMKSERLTLKFVGDSVYVKGKSIETELIPYRPYVRKQSNVSQLQVFGFNNPAFASSSNEGSAPGLAADGNKKTYWEASPTDVSPFWILDTEKELLLKQVSILFPKAGKHSFKIEISSNQKDWKLVDSQKNIEDNVSEKVIDVNDASLKGRFIRISFDRSVNYRLAALSEVTVKGFVL